MGIGLIYITYVCVYVHMLVLNCEKLNCISCIPFVHSYSLFFVVCVCVILRFEFRYHILSIRSYSTPTCYLLHHYWDSGRKSQIRTEQSSPAEARKYSRPGRGHQDTQFTSLTPWAPSMEAIRLDTTASPSVWVV